MNTISKRAVTRKDVQASMEQAIVNGCGARVDVTMMGENTWSICGKPSHACKAIEHLEATKLVKEFGERSTLEGELFIYFKTGA